MVQIQKKRTFFFIHDFFTERIRNKDNFEG